MIQKINRTEEIREKFRKEGKVNTLNSPQHIEAINKMNKEMEGVKRDYKVKDSNSQASASTVVLTA